MPTLSTFSKIRQKKTSIFLTVHFFPPTRTKRNTICAGCICEYLLITTELWFFTSSPNSSARLWTDTSQISWQADPVMTSSACVTAHTHYRGLSTLLHDSLSRHTLPACLQCDCVTTHRSSRSKHHHQSHRPQSGGCSIGSGAGTITCP